MTARDTIIEAIKARGVTALSAAAGVHFSRVYAFINGGGLDPVNAGRLRAVMPEVEERAWLDLQAPVPVEATP